MNDTGPAESRAAQHDAVLQPGSNCWCIEQAERAAVIIDGADYFDAFAAACLGARRQILILGWDFDRHLALHRDDKVRDLPDQVGAFLAELLRQRRELRVYLLSWDFNLIYAAERELLPAIRLRLQVPKRFHFRLDANHPPGASQHQKVVVIDDRVAFVGGIDLARWRWDTSEHRPDDARRVDPEGRHYPPFHDLMLLVEGDAAKRLGDLARERWRRARGRVIDPVGGQAGRSPWPAAVSADFVNVPVAIARTEPAYQGRQAIAEVERLYLDAIRSAERFIYIENQYFTAHVLAEALASRLAEDKGPEVILVLPQHTGGWLEQLTMDVLRGRVVRQMQQADTQQRLRIYYPFQPGLGETCISVHSKLLIVDDRLLRIGSSNTSNRSMGLDTECDLAIESAAAGDGIASAIRDLRQRLLAEHLGCTADRVGEAEQQQPSLLAAVEALRGDGRSLRELDYSVDPDIDGMLPESGLVDPPEPLSGDYFVTRYVPDERRPGGRRRLLAFLLMLLALLGLAAAWRWTPLHEYLSPDRLSGFLLTLGSPTARSLIAVSAIVLASLLMVPLTILAVVAVIVFAGWEGFLYIFIGALLSAALGFFAGKFLGRGMLRRLSGPQLDRLSRRLAKRGTVAVAVLRLVPVAPFAVFNLVAGASHVGFRQFIVGSALGLVPGLLAITLFSSSLWEAIRAPSWASVSLAVGVGAGLTALVLLMKRWLRSG